MIEDLPLAHLAQTGCRDHRGVLEEEERFCRKNLENDDDDLTLMNDGLKTTIRWWWVEAYGGDERKMGEKNTVFC